MSKRKGFAAVVESGSCSTDYQFWEERQNCGHLHKTVEAAEECGKRHYDAKYVNGSWQANAAWHGYTVHDQDGKRVNTVESYSPYLDPSLELIPEDELASKAGFDPELL